MARVRIFTVLFPFVCASLTYATPIIAVDLDPTVAGIQPTRSLGVGALFDVDIVLVGDGVTPYDTAIVDVLFNDAGLVLGWMGDITAGSLAGTVVLALDAVGPGIVGAGVPLTPSASLPTPPFASGIGGAGYFSLTGPFPVTGTFTLFNVSFLAMSPGASTLGLAGDLGGPELAFMGFPVPSAIQTGAITVRGAPEPGTLGLFGIGFVAILVRFRKHAGPGSRLPNAG